MTSLITMPGELPHPPERSIVLETSQGRSVPNRQILEIALSPTERISERDLLSKPAYQWRGKPTNIYNCHGLTFASRRTGIEKPEAIAMILEDDKYKEITESNALPGDVVLYKDISGDIEHSAILIECTKGNLNPNVLSKFGKYAEAIHPLKNCDYYDPDRTTITYHRAWS